jgi:hypothetical protein
VPDIVIPYGMENKLFYFILFLLPNIAFAAEPRFELGDCLV